MQSSAWLRSAGVTVTFLFFLGCNTSLPYERISSICGFSSGSFSDALSIKRKSDNGAGDPFSPLASYATKPRGECRSSNAYSRSALPLARTDNQLPNTNDEYSSLTLKRTCLGI